MVQARGIAGRHDDGLRPCRERLGKRGRQPLPQVALDLRAYDQLWERGGEEQHVGR
jgi:hypothetical protein